MHRRMIQHFWRWEQGMSEVSAEFTDSAGKTKGALHDIFPITKWELNPGNEHTAGIHL